MIESLGRMTVLVRDYDEALSFHRDKLGSRVLPDGRAAVARFESRGVEIRRPPREEGGSIFAHILDLYGNEWVIAQLDAS